MTMPATPPYTLLITPLGPDAVASAAELDESFRVVDSSEPALRVGELSTQRGDGIFETIGLVNGHAQELEPHLARLERSAQICELPAPNLAQWRRAVSRTVAALPPTGEFAIKLVLSRGVEAGPTPTAWVHASAAADFTTVRSHGVRVITLDRGYDSAAAERAPWLLLGAKTLSYAVNMAALREAARRGADDAIFLSSDGYVLEGPTSSVILRHGRNYSTPAPRGAILHGTTQLSLFEHLKASGKSVEYRDIPSADLARADGAWLLSSIRLAVAITAIDGAQLATNGEETAAFNAYLRSPRD